MAKKTKAKKISFRQRLRNDAAERLDSLQSKARDAVIQVLIDGKVNLAADDLMKAMSSSQTKTLRENLITQLANDHNLIRR